MTLGRRLLLKTLPSLFVCNSVAKANNPNHVHVGALRWDAWYGGSNGSPSYYAQHNLDPSQYQFRAPFFATKLTSSSLQIDGNSQEVIDAEIQYAHQAGLAYWCFGRHPNEDAFSIPLKRYQKSTYKNMLRYCLRVSPNGQFYKEVSDGTLLHFFSQKNYETVLGNRPLLYLSLSRLVTKVDPLTTAIKKLRTLCLGQNLGNPYVVSIVLDGSLNDTVNTTVNIGADAISDYASYGSGKRGETYDSFARANSSRWDAMKATGLATIPLCSTGYDPRPRVGRAGPWNAGSSGREPHYAQIAKPDEIEEHVRELLVWIGQNRHCCPTNTALLYAWNEFDEGGWICPTWTPYGPDHSRIDALRAALVSGR